MTSFFIRLTLNEPWNRRGLGKKSTDLEKVLPIIDTAQE